MDSKVTRKAQVTVPVELRRKYSIRQGVTVVFEDSSSGIILRVVPRFQDLIGVDAEKVELEQTLRKLDEMRLENRH